MLLRRKIVGLIVLLSCFNAKAQLNGSSFSPQMDPADSLANNFYISHRGSALSLYNGRLFHGYGGYKGNGYYAFSDWAVGSIQYDGIWYDSVKLIYDIYADDIIVRSLNNDPVILFKDRVQKFTLQGLQFIRLQADKDGVIRTGFYQVLALGKLTIIARRTKLVDEKIEDGMAIREFRATNRFYAYKDGVYHSFNKQKKLLALVRESKSSIQQQLRKEGIRWKTNRELVMSRIANIYNQTSR